jgi:hypothetical protein
MSPGTFWLSLPDISYFYRTLIGPAWFLVHSDASCLADMSCLPLLGPGKLYRILPRLA